MVVATVLPAHAWRTPPNEHPYKLAGREIYVRIDDVELEIGECGLAHPEVLRGCGLPTDASGLAMGLGLDRLTMLAKGIDDIRLLRSADPRVAEQMRDLPPYRPVSTMPTARRDLSLAVPDTLDAELLGDRVRTILGTKARAVEEVIVLSETAYIDLSEPVRARLGISPEHKNVLLRLILRDLDRTLSSAQATDYGTWCTRAYTSARPTSGLLTLGSLRLRLSPRQRHHREPGRRTSRVGVRQPARP